MGRLLVCHHDIFYQNPPKNLLYQFLRFNLRLTRLIPSTTTIPTGEREVIKPAHRLCVADGLYCL